MRSVREREALERYLEQLEQSDEQDEVVIDPSAVASALEKLHRHPEPEVSFMRTTHGFIPAYNVQAAVDAEHALIVAQQVTIQAGDNGSLQPMAEAAQAAAGRPAQPINVVADAGYSNGEQADACEAKGILPHVPANRGVNTRGDGTLFDRTEFTYRPESDTFLCPTGQTLTRKQLMRKAFRVLAQRCMHHVTVQNGSPRSAKQACGDAPNTTHYYQQLDALWPLRQEARRALLVESRKHKIWKLLRQIPAIGPIRAAILIAVMQTPHRFRTKRHLWTYSGLGLETYDSAEYRAVRGQLERSRKQATV